MGRWVLILGLMVFIVSIVLQWNPFQLYQPWWYLSSWGGKGAVTRHAHPQPSPSRLHFVYSVECTSYMDWQTIVLEHSFTIIRQRGNITRLVACDNPDEHDGLRDYPLISQTFYHRSYTRDLNYSPLNKPRGIQAWLNKTTLAPDTIVVILDSDMILTGRLPELQPGYLRGRALAAEYNYMPFKGLSLAPDWVTPPGDPQLAAPVGVPVIIHHDDLRRMVGSWGDLTVALHGNGTVRALTQDDGWTVEMYAYSFAAARHGIAHSVRGDLMLYPPNGYSDTPPWILHYGIGFATHGVMFDKHHYFTPDKNPLSCSYDWPWYSGRVPSVWPPARRRSTDCFQARGQAAGALVVEMVHEAVRWYRQMHAQCSQDPQELASASMRVLEYPSFWVTLDSELSCAPEYDLLFQGQPRALPANARPVQSNYSAVVKESRQRGPKHAPDLAVTSRASMHADLTAAGLSTYPRYRGPDRQRRVVVDQVMTPQECVVLMDLLDRSYPTSGVKGFSGQDVSAVSGHEMDRSLPGQLTVLGDVHERILSIARQVFPRDNLHFDFTHATRRQVSPKGYNPRRGHLIHADSCANKPDGSCIVDASYCCAWRNVSAVLLLNSPDSNSRPFVGGDFVFVDNAVGDNAINVRPQCGRLAIFTSGPENLHGVRAVKSGYRYALASWFTTNDSHRDSDYENLLRENRLPVDHSTIPLLHDNMNNEDDHQSPSSSVAYGSGM